MKKFFIIQIRLPKISTEIVQENRILAVSRECRGSGGGVLVTRLASCYCPKLRGDPIWALSPEEGGVEAEAEETQWGQPIPPGLLPINTQTWPLPSVPGQTFCCRKSPMFAWIILAFIGPINKTMGLLTERFGELGLLPWKDYFYLQIQDTK